MKVKTRERILSASLALFNELGEPNVTTLLISDELDISPGNLYYHFRSKGDIVTELFERFQGEIHDLLAIPDDVQVDLEQLAFFLHLLFESIARYRFLYQDLVNILSRYDNLQKAFRHILDRKESGFRLLCQSLERQQKIRLNESQTDALCRQLTMTVCYWSSFDSLRDLKDRSKTNPGRGVYQVLHLLLPHLPQDAQQEILSISEDYR